MYRPKGWESPYKAEYMSPTTSVKLQARTHNLAYEEGADAILRIIYNRPYITTETLRKLGIEGLQDGKWYCIPDDKED